MWYVTGGEYTDTNFKTLIGEQMRFGAFSTSEEAKKVWRAQSMKFIDFCYYKFRIERILDA